MRSVKGVLVSCGDAAVKQILVWMDATAERRFIVQDLDDTHLVVNADAVHSTLRALEEHLEKNMYSSDALLTN